MHVVYFEVPGAERFSSEGVGKGMGRETWVEANTISNLLPEMKRGPAELFDLARTLSRVSVVYRFC